MGIPPLEGREFSWLDDRLGNQRAAIVNQTFARSFLQGQTHLGAMLDLRNSAWRIVGVVGDTRQGALDRDPLPEIYLSISQVGADGATYIVRTRKDGSGLAKTIAAAVVLQDPHLEQVSPAPLRLTLERSLNPRKVALQLVGAFGGVALLLTALGIHGIVAFRARERSREMAIRSALGATAPQIRRLVLRNGLWIGLAGLVMGLPVFWVARPLLRHQLYGVSLSDPLSLAAVTLLVLAIVLASSWAPSHRAANAAPAGLLRDN
jgi:ABC-type antimicrobial peptide transport system permease subunit